MSPFALLREMTDFMDQTFGRTGGSSQQSRGQGGGQSWLPAMEVREKDGSLLVCADLPGIDKNDVKVEIDNDMLVIEGERKQEHTAEEGGFHRTERSYGRFYRAIPLPEGTQTDQARAEFRNGVLEVTVPLPKEQEKSRRQIQIQGESSGSSSSSSQQHGSGQQGSQPSAQSSQQQSSQSHSGPQQPTGAKK